MLQMLPIRNIFLFIFISIQYILYLYFIYFSTTLYHCQMSQFAPARSQLSTESQKVILKYSTLLNIVLLMLQVNQWRLCVKWRATPLTSHSDGHSTTLLSSSGTLDTVLPQPCCHNPIPSLSKSESKVQVQSPSLSPSLSPSQESKFKV